MEGEDDGLDKDGLPGTEGGGTAGADTEPTEDEAGVPTGQSDDGSDDGEPEGEVELGEREEGYEQAAKTSRGETRIQRLANETRQAREEAAEARREAQELRRQSLASQQQLTQEQETQRLALMTPEERAEYRVAQMERRTQQTIAQSEFRTHDLVDKASFDAKATLNPVYSRYQSEVEDRLKEMRASGQNVAREQLLRWVIGDKALSTAGSSSKKAAVGAQKRVAAQKVPAGNSKGDTASRRGKEADTPEKRLKDVFI